MDLLIVAVGRLKRGPETELCSRYLDRTRNAGRPVGLGQVRVREVAESRAQRAADRKAQEAEALSAAVPAGYQIFCLDEAGEAVDSRGLADLVRGAADRGVPGQAFLIGGADGLDAGLLGRSERRLSFGRLTWPHQFVRVMMAEQLYRVMTLLAGHPYHRQ